MTTSITNQMKLLTIVRRVEALYPHFKIDRLALMMDIEAAILHTPLDLDRWIASDNFNFMHDVHGIQSSLNRETGELENCFRPRFALQQELSL